MFQMHANQKEIPARLRDSTEFRRDDGEGRSTENYINTPACAIAPAGKPACREAG
ncbi:hypothetical protein [Fulvivirga sedimenti]|uniref:Uncharacterized protein n=1 Tax=Fulvivirga sedimenti TaxID=2879465 RepID=A0A9X1HRE9_9BACT|nr:hypothetical protein [Fulvivirga sedimenti]MCA6075608.1 hypothetical protein [Fulvivirga sedimenti]